MTRRFTVLLALFLLALSQAYAANESGSEMSAALVDRDPNTGEFLLKGNARLVSDGAILLADEIRLNRETNVATARGHVTLTQGARRVIADEVVYNRATKSYSVKSMRMGEYPFYVSGDSVTGTDRELTVRNATLTYFEPGPFTPTLKADKLAFTPHDRIRASDARLGLGGGPMIPLTTLSQSVDEPLISYMNAKIGRGSRLGWFVDLGLHLPVWPGVRAGGDLAFYTDRGVMIGPSGTYRVGDETVQDTGSFESGYIHDYGDRLTDVLNRPIRADRSFVSWSHRRTDKAENLSIVTDFNFWSDSSVLRDFRPGDFFPLQQPDNFIEVTKTTPNIISSVFLRAQPNTYYRVQQRLPEIRLDGLPAPIGLGAYHWFSASAAWLRERQFSITPESFATRPTQESKRLDFFYGLNRPVHPREWLTLTPVVGGRFTHYVDTPAYDRDDYTRVLGEVGADASLRASGVYDYKNERWDIDGIRHLVTPKLSYRYIPKADKGRAYIPQIDDRVFDTALQPLELGSLRNIDQLHATNTLRVGVDNTFQTRDKTYGSRDLLVLNIAQDFRFKKNAGERDSSEIHTGFSLMPAPWMQFDLYNSFSPHDFSARELNTRLTLIDGDVWSQSFSNHFLDRQINEYISETRYRITEAYQAVLRLHWDARRSRFVESSLKVVQNLNNTWLVEYGLTRYEGRRRESGDGGSDFGYGVNFRLIGL